MSRVPLRQLSVRRVLNLLLALGAVIAARATAQSTAASGFIPGGRDIVNLDFAGTPIGELPKGLRLLQGNLEVVDKDGVHMLRASSPSEFVIQLPEALPRDFTVEFELIPKACCNPEDLMLEGVISGSRSSVSAQLTWHPGHLMVVGGNSSMFQMDMPAAIGAVLPSALTKVVVSFEDETVKMYTNGRRLYTLAERKFARGRVMRISLGGQDEDKYAVYLARVRIAESGPGAVASSQAASTGSGLSNLLNGGGTLSTVGGGAVPVSTSAPVATTVTAPSNPGVTAGPLPSGTVVPTSTQTAATQPAALSSSSNPLLVVPSPTTTQQQSAATAQLPFATATAPAPVSAGTGPLSSITAPAASSSKLAGPAKIFADGWSVNSTPPGWGVAIAWTPVAGATSYQVTRTVSGSGTPGAPIQVTNLPSAWTQNQAVAVLDTQVEPWVEYTYWVEGVTISGVLTNPSAITTAVSRVPPPINNLSATVGGTTQVVLPGSFGANGPTRGSNVTWKWDAIPAAFVYETSYEIIGKMDRARKTLQASITMPATIAPITFGVPQGSSVRFCVSVWAPPGLTMPLPSTATCLTTQVP